MTERAMEPEINAAQQAMRKERATETQLHLTGQETARAALQEEARTASAKQERAPEAATARDDWSATRAEDEAALGERWPALSEAAESTVKEAFENAASAVDEVARDAIEALSGSTNSAEQQAAAAQYEAATSAMDDIRREVGALLEQGAQPDAAAIAQACERIDAVAERMTNSASETEAVSATPEQAQSVQQTEAREQGSVLDATAAEASWSAGRSEDEAALGERWVALGEEAEATVKAAFENAASAVDEVARDAIEALSGATNSAEQQAAAAQYEAATKAMDDIRREVRALLEPGAQPHEAAITQACERIEAVAEQMTNAASEEAVSAAVEQAQSVQRTEAREQGSVLDAAAAEANWSAGRSEDEAALGERWAALSKEAEATVKAAFENAASAADQFARDAVAALSAATNSAEQQAAAAHYEAATKAMDDIRGEVRALLERGAEPAEAAITQAFERIEAAAETMAWDAIEAETGWTISEDVRQACLAPKLVTIPAGQELHAAGRIEKTNMPDGMKWGGFEENDILWFTQGNQLRSEWYAKPGETAELYQFKVIVSEPTRAIMSKVADQQNAPTREGPSKFQYYNPEGFRNFQLVRREDGQPIALGHVNAKGEFTPE